MISSAYSRGEDHNQGCHGASSVSRMRLWRRERMPNAECGIAIIAQKKIGPEMYETITKPGLL